MKRLTIAALALTAGCALTPKEVIEQGPRSVHELRQPPALAAGCMARNIENHRQSYSSHVRAIDASTTELVVRMPQAENAAMAVAHVTPSRTGSTATIWMSPHTMHAIHRDLEAMLAGC